MTDGNKEIMDSIMQPTDRLLELIGLAWEGEGRLTAFAGVQGKADLGLAVVGRAPAAGPTSFTADDMRGAYGRNKVLTALRKQPIPRGDLSSPFWQTGKAVAEAREDVAANEVSWMDRIGWTNLYRVAPVDGELPEGLRTLQLPLCAQLFWREILIWRPRRVLFMTGLDWAAPFVFAHHSSELEADRTGTYVKASGALRLQGARTPALVVLDPPQPGEDVAERAHEVAGVFASLGA